MSEGHWVFYKTMSIRVNNLPFVVIVLVAVFVGVEIVVAEKVTEVGENVVPKQIQFTLLQKL